MMDKRLAYYWVGFFDGVLLFAEINYISQSPPIEYIIVTSMACVLLFSFSSPIAEYLAEVKEAKP